MRRNVGVEWSPARRRAVSGVLTANGVGLDRPDESIACLQEWLALLPSRLVLALRGDDGVDGFVFLVGLGLEVEGALHDLRGLKDE